MKYCMTWPFLGGVFVLSACGGGGTNNNTTPSPVTTSTNSAPIVATANSDQTSTAGTAFNYDATQNGTTFSDPDGDTLTYTVSFAPQANALSANAGVISGTPSQDGTITVTISASDGNGGQVDDVFDIVVGTATTSNTKPNILLVITDDQGKDASAEYSLSTYQPVSPNFSALATDGLIFDNLWVSPTCSPTRAAMISGKYGHATQVLSPGDALSPGDIILQSFMESEPETSDYVSAMIGKWHLGGGRTGPNDAGLDHFVGILNGGVQDYFNWTKTENGTNSQSTDYVTSELVDEAIDWVAAQTQPWFLWLSFNAPHTPFHLPPNALHNRSLTGSQADINANPRPYYLAAIEAMDTEFGRFWNSLSMTEQNNTVVIFLGDNGTPAQVIDRTINQSGNKNTLFQGGVNTPMFVSGPGVTRNGEREGALITHTDFFPTIVELAGGTLSNYQDGSSFFELLSTGTSSHRRFAYTDNAAGFTIRNATYKLIEETSGNQNLYDLDTDPAEASDLLNSGSTANAIVKELSDEASRIRGSQNITGMKFTNTSANCVDYLGQYQSVANDIGNDRTFQGTTIISSNTTSCTISSNSIPNHDFNDVARGFANDVDEVDETFTFTRSPGPTGVITPLSISRDNAILLNGVKVNVLAAACFGVGNERSGCGDDSQPWRFDPMFAANGFNVDNNNAHAQSDGAYHYHGPPPIYNGDAMTVSGVIGFAADGYPIYGPYFDDNGVIRAATSSYRLRSGDRPTGAGNPGGTYDGTYRDDYEFVAG